MLNAARITPIPYVLLLVSCGSPEAQVAPPPLPVEIASVSAPTGDVIRAAGTVAWERESALSFRVPGVVRMLGVEIGDRVGAGQLLAALDSTDTAARLKQAEEDVARAARTAERYAAMAETGAIARAQAQDQDTLRAQALAALQSARFDQRSTRLTAPFGGVVLARIAQRGEVVSPGQEVVRVADLSSPLLVRVPVPSGTVGQVRRGAPARVRAGAQLLTGKVQRIGSQADGRTGTVTVEIALPAGSGLASGTVVQVELDPVSAAPAPVARVPAEAVLEAKGETATVFLFDRRQSRAVRKTVRFAGFDGDAALLGGLSGDAAVITSGAGYVRDGQRVVVANGR